MAPEGQGALNTAMLPPDTAKERTAPFPGGGGGRPPARPLLLREIRRVHNGNISGLAVSEHFNLIATSSSDNTIRVLDYLSLLLRGVYSVPKLMGQHVECSVLSFVPNLPVLLGADVRGRITMWTVSPLKPAWVYTWPVTLGSQVTNKSNARNPTSDPIPEDEEVEDELTRQANSQLGGKNSKERVQFQRQKRNSVEESLSIGMVGVAVLCMKAVTWKNNTMTSSMRVNENTRIVKRSTSSRRLGTTSDPEDSKDTPETLPKSQLLDTLKSSAEPKLESESKSTSSSIPSMITSTPISRLRSTSKRISKAKSLIRALGKEMDVTSVIVGDDIGRIFCFDISQVESTILSLN